MPVKRSLPRLGASLLAATGFVLGDSFEAGFKRTIEVDGTKFALNGDNVSYRFHVDNATGDLRGDHFGGPVQGDTIEAEVGPVQGWVSMIGRVRRELPDLGRGDFRIPALQIRQSQGHTVSEFKYQSHEVVDGKPDLMGLPSTFGGHDDVSTLTVRLYDNYSSVAADLSYSIFPKYDAIVRSINITNMGKGNITLKKLASFSLDLPLEEYDMVELKGDWAREGMRARREVSFGTQGFGSTTGYSSHLHNPFLSLVAHTTTEFHGEAYGFSLVYSGSFAVEVERGSQGLIRAMLGLNPSQFSWPLGPGDSFVSPECVAMFSSTGIGGMSRKLHGLYRRHLMKNLGVKLFVLDDGWFGNKYPRVSDNAGLGDWSPSRERFPNGFKTLVDDITRLSVAYTADDKLDFGIWVESEMVNPNSTLYEEHPDWALHAGDYPRTLARNQLVLNIALPEVQEFVVESVSNILDSYKVSYVKWDNNRGIHETPASCTDHQYMLGLYKVYKTLVEKYPQVLWEGCASGGGRFDPGILHYFPQIWTSDNTDAAERVYIHFGTSLAYPPSAMGAHLSATPNGQTGRDESIEFRAHVAMMGGSFGLELNPAHMTRQDKAKIPDLIKLAERVNPIVVKGDMWRLRLPEESNYPAALFFSADGKQAVLFCFKLFKAHINDAWPVIRLQGLDAGAVYRVDGNQTVSGATLMNKGISYQFKGDFDSRVVFLEKA